MPMPCIPFKLIVLNRSMAITRLAVQGVTIYILINLLIKVLIYYTKCFHFRNFPVIKVDYLSRNLEASLKYLSKYVLLYLHTCC